MGGIRHTITSNMLDEYNPSQKGYRGTDSHEIAEVVDFGVYSHKFDHLVESTAEHGINLEGMNVKQTATVIELLAETAGDELRVVQTRAYDAASQIPLWQLHQKSTGECVVRYLHADNDGTKYWVHGQLGRQVGVGIAHNSWYLVLDGTAVALRAHYATDYTAGRILINTESWTAAPTARLEVRGSADEIQALFKGHSTQTNVIAQVVTSADANVISFGSTVQLGVDLDMGGYDILDGGTITINEIYGQSGTDYINTKNADSGTLTFRARDTGNTVIKVGAITGAADPYFALGGSNELVVTAAGLIGFYGATAVAKQTGCAVPTDLATALTAITALRTALNNYGLTTVV